MNIKEVPVNNVDKKTNKVLNWKQSPIIVNKRYAIDPTILNPNS